MNINTPTQGGFFAIPFMKPKAVTIKRTESGRTGSIRSNRIPFLRVLPDNARNHFVATSAEYVGTTLFLFFAFSGTQVALLATTDSGTSTIGSVSNPAQLLYISLCFGFSLAVNAWVFFRISGGLFNPAVTLGMCLVGALPYLRGIFLVIAQILGGITAAAICSALFPGPLTVRTNLGGGTSVVQGLFIEMFLSAELVFTIFMLAAEKHKGTFIAPIGIGLSLFIAELTGVYFTGGSVNPARSFGPSVVSHQFHTYHWIYWVGPILGSLLASGFYKFIKMLEYETANPGQDRNKPEGEHFNPNAPEHDVHLRVNFKDDEHAMEEGTLASGVGSVGTPKEYGGAPRPHSDSPAPPHPNDQFTGLEAGGMHNRELREKSEPPRAQPQRMQTGGRALRTQDLDAHLPDDEDDYELTGGSGEQNFYAGKRERSRETQIPRELEHLRAQQGAARKPAMKPGSRGSDTVGKERGVRHNTRTNRGGGLGSGFPVDQEGYGEER